MVLNVSLFKKAIRTSSIFARKFDADLYRESFDEWDKWMKLKISSQREGELQPEIAQNLNIKEDYGSISAALPSASRYENNGVEYLRMQANSSSQRLSETVVVKPMPHRQAWVLLIGFALIWCFFLPSRRKIGLKSLRAGGVPNDLKHV